MTCFVMMIVNTINIVEVIIIIIIIIVIILNPRLKNTRRWSKKIKKL